MAGTCKESTIVFLPVDEMKRKVGPLSNGQVDINTGPVRINKPFVYLTNICVCLISSDKRLHQKLVNKIHISLISDTNKMRPLPHIFTMSSSFYPRYRRIVFENIIAVVVVYCPFLALGAVIGFSTCMNIK